MGHISYLWCFCRQRVGCVKRSLWRSCRWQRLLRAHCGDWAGLKSYSDRKIDESVQWLGPLRNRPGFPSNLWMQNYQQLNSVVDHGCAEHYGRRCHHSQLRDLHLLDAAPRCGCYHERVLLAELKPTSCDSVTEIKHFKSFALWGDVFVKYWIKITDRKWLIDY